MTISEKLVKQYETLKQESPGSLLLMQVGAFMQVFDEDARTVSAVTGLKLKMAGDVNQPFVTGGFPKLGLDQYVGKLVRAGHSLAIAFQDEEKHRAISEIIRLNQPIPE
jgi:DNA mismatch repair protein MutS